MKMLFGVGSVMARSGCALWSGSVRAAAPNQLLQQTAAAIGVGEKSISLGAAAATDFTVCCQMKRQLIITGIVLALGIAVVFGLDWHFFWLTGRFTPKKIVETLTRPVAIVSVRETGLRAADSRMIPLPGVPKVVTPASVTEDIIEHGVEIQPDGTIFALIRVHHWCGNDPVRFHLARLDLSSLLLLLGEEKQSLVSEYGIDPGVCGMATIPHQEIEKLLHHNSSEQAGAAKGSRPFSSETSTTSSAAGSRPYPAQAAEGRAESEAAKPPSIDELLLFFPSKYPAGNWAPKDLRFDDVWFAAEDKTRLHGWYCPCDNPRATILIAHGNAGNITFRVSWLKYLQSKARVATFMFDYRGFGRSEGVPTVEGALRDAKAAREKLRELARIEDSAMLLMGESLGGAIVVRLAAESAPRGLVLQSTFSSLKDVADVHYPKLSWLVPPAKLDSVAQIARYHGPLLQSHGTADGTIPFSSGQKLFRAANEPKTFVTIPGADHNDWLTEDYLRELDGFVHRVAAERNRTSN
jgi:hypothetical protein